MQIKILRIQHEHRTQAFSHNFILKEPIMARPNQAKLIKAMLTINNHLGALHGIPIAISLSNGGKNNDPTGVQPPSSLLTPKHAARILNKSQKTLANYRSSGVGGPPFFKDGGNIYYRVDDIVAYIDQHVKLSTSEFTNHRRHVFQR